MPDSSPIHSISFTVNGRGYRPPARPVVVICIDGCGDEYLSTSLAQGRMPHTAAMIRRGWRSLVRGALPSFTNVNNAAIATGVRPAVTGIAGNYFLDPDSGQEVMMNSASYLRCGTILAAAARAGRRVAMVTAKEKLRDILSDRLEGIAFSSERASAATAATHGIDDVERLVDRPTPEIYSAEASLFVLAAGAALVEHMLADFLYLSLTDYVQHKYAPHEPQSLDFYARIDEQIGRLLELGAVVGATADHGMNAKNGADGGPNVVYLESLLERQFGSEVKSLPHNSRGTGVSPVSHRRDACATNHGPGIKVICPITDPYVVHHGALGSLVMVHLPDGIDHGAVARWVLELPGVTEIYDRATAARKLELPPDRIGDLVVMSGRDVVLGRRPEDHDLSALGGRLRSHGGRYEEMVPLLVSEPLSDEYLAKAAGDPRNFDVFDFTCNGARR